MFLGVAIDPIWLKIVEIAKNGELVVDALPDAAPTLHDIFISFPSSKNI